MKTITEMATELQSTNNHFHIQVTCKILCNSIDHIARWLPFHTNVKSPEYSLHRVTIEIFLIFSTRIHIMLMKSPVKSSATKVNLIYYT